MRTIFRRLYFIIKRFFGSKAFKFALQEGLVFWIQVDTEFGGKLDKSKYQTVSGNWKKGGEAAYQKEKSKRQDMWFNMLRAAIDQAFPGLRGVTSLLYMVHGMLGAQEKAKTKPTDKPNKTKKPKKNEDTTQNDDGELAEKKRKSEENKSPESEKKPAPGKKQAQKTK